MITYRGFPSGDNTETWAQEKRLEDPSYLKDDWYINSTQNFSVRFFFNYLFYFFNIFINNAYFTNALLFLICNSLITYFTYLISNKLFLDKIKSQFIALFAFIFGSGISLATVLLMRKDFATQSVSLVFVFISLYFLLDDRKKWSYLFAGFATIFHTIVGLHFFGFLFFYEFLKQLFLNKKLNFGEFFKTWPFFIVSSINLIPLAFIQITSVASQSQLIVEIMRFRGSHLYFPSSFGFLEIFATISFFLYFLYAFSTSNISIKHRFLVFSFVFISLIYFALGIIFVEIIPIKLFIKLQFFRNTIILYFFCFLFIANEIYVVMQKSKYFSLKLINYILPILFTFEILYILAPLIRVFERIYLFMLRKKLKHGPLFELLVFLIFLGFSSFLVIKFNVIDFIILNFKDIIQFIILPFALILIVRSILLDSKKRYLFIILLLFVILNFAQISIQGHRESSIDPVFDYLKYNTPKDSVILSPPGMDQLRVFSDRAIIVDFKSFPYSENKMLEWFDRISDVSNNNTQNLDKGYNSLNEEDINNLRDKYGVDYALFEKPKELYFDNIFESEKYILFKLD